MCLASIFAGLCRHSSLICRLTYLSAGAFAIRTKWLANWLGETGCMASGFFPTDASAALSDSIRWSATSGSPEVSYFVSRAWHAVSRHARNVDRTVSTRDS